MAKKETNKGVFSDIRTLISPPASQVFKDKKLTFNHRYQMDGLKLMNHIKDSTIPLVIFDPQYRGILDKMDYGNEGERQKGRSSLLQMPEAVIKSFLKEIDRILTPKGHLFLWVDKFHLVEGVKPWLSNLKLAVVDMIVWDKARMGMGYRTRKQSEYLLIFQKLPLRAKDVWSDHCIRDVWQEKIIGTKKHPHQKPINLQSTLIKAVTNCGDIVLDPAAGSFSVLEATKQTNRLFLGTNLKNKEDKMSLISERKGKSSGAYERILGNKKLDLLISKVQATTISAGRELENLIYQNSSAPVIKDEDGLKTILTATKNNGSFIIDKALFKVIQNGGKNQPDFIIVDTENKQINVIELKEGWVFDTKKSEGEFQHLKDFKMSINGYLETLESNQKPIFKVMIYICSFHAPSKADMVAGTKKKIPIEFFLTNDEFCEMVSADFHKIKTAREEHKENNFKFFINSLADIPEVAQGILEATTDKLKQKNTEN